MSTAIIVRALEAELDRAHHLLVNTISKAVWLGGEPASRSRVEDAGGLILANAMESIRLIDEATLAYDDVADELAAARASLATSISGSAGETT